MCSLPLAFRNGDCIRGEQLPAGYQDRSVVLRCTPGGGGGGGAGGANSAMRAGEAAVLTLALGFFAALVAALLAKY